jgi:hypothetical protein
MMAFIRPRLRKPAVIALAGSAFASAWLVRGGPSSWWWSIAVETVVLVRAVTLYVRAGEDTDDGALAGSRADERQQLIAVRSRALAGNVALVAALAGFAIAVAARSPWWPFAVMFLVTGFGYLFGRSIYGSSESDLANEPDADREARSPVTS